ncbi:MAG: type II toxin-antitoxin system VapC family toxin [bacterium]|nr:type II toxin-antitoxin system VapC family toxin [bacterium]
MVILDTSALIFWTLDPNRLSRTAEKAISDTDRILISSISIWEIGIKVKKGNLTLPLSLQEYVQNLQHLDRFEIVPVDETTWLKNIELNWEHRDPADRTIVATAILHAGPLITSDERIRSFYSAAVW